MERAHPAELRTYEDVAAYLGKLPARGSASVSRLDPQREVERSYPLISTGLRAEYERGLFDRSFLQFCAPACFVSEWQRYKKLIVSTKTLDHHELAGLRFPDPLPLPRDSSKWSACFFPCLGVTIVGVTVGRRPTHDEVRTQFAAWHQQCVQTAMREWLGHIALECLFGMLSKWAVEVLSRRWAEEEMRKSNVARVLRDFLAVKTKEVQRECMGSTVCIVEWPPDLAHVRASIHSGEVARDPATAGRVLQEMKERLRQCLADLGHAKSAVLASWEGASRRAFCARVSTALLEHVERCRRADGLALVSRAQLMAWMRGTSTSVAGTTTPPAQDPHQRAWRAAESALEAVSELELFHTISTTDLELYLAEQAGGGDASLHAVPSDTEAYASLLQASDLHAQLRHVFAELEEGKLATPLCDTTSAADEARRQLAREMIDALNAYIDDMVVQLRAKLNAHLDGVRARAVPLLSMIAHTPAFEHQTLPTSRHPFAAYLHTSREDWRRLVGVMSTRYATLMRTIPRWEGRLVPRLSGNKPRLDEWYEYVRALARLVCVLEFSALFGQGHIVVDQVDVRRVESVAGDWRQDRSAARAAYESATATATAATDPKRRREDPAPDGGADD